MHFLVLDKNIEKIDFTFQNHLDQTLSQIVRSIRSNGIYWGWPMMSLLRKWVSFCHSNLQYNFLLWNVLMGVGITDLTLFSSLWYIKFFLIFPKVQDSMCGCHLNPPESVIITSSFANNKLCWIELDQSIKKLPFKAMLFRYQHNHFNPPNIQASSS